MPPAPTAISQLDESRTELRNLGKVVPAVGAEDRTSFEMSLLNHYVSKLTTSPDRLYSVLIKTLEEAMSSSLPGAWVPGRPSALDNPFVLAAEVDKLQSELLRKLSDGIEGALGKMKEYLVDDIIPSFLPDIDLVPKRFKLLTEAVQLVVSNQFQALAHTRMLIDAIVDDAGRLLKCRLPSPASPSPPVPSPPDVVDSNRSRMMKFISEFEAHKDVRVPAMCIHSL